MTIAVERIEVLGTNVPDVEAAQGLFSELFGLEFSVFRFRMPSSPEDHVKAVPEPKSSGGRATAGSQAGGLSGADDGPTMRAAIDATGYLEFIESGDPTSHGMRNIHFKVSDIEAAVAEMEEKGVRVLARMHVGAMHEVIFDPEDLFGIRLCFVEYAGPSLVEALLDDQ